MTWSNADAPLVELHLERGDLAGEPVQARRAAAGTVELGDGVLALPGDLGAPLLQPVEVGARREIGEVGVGQGGLRHGQLAVVLLDLPVQCGQPAGRRAARRAASRTSAKPACSARCSAASRAVSAAVRARTSSVAASTTASQRSASLVSRAMRAARSVSSPRAALS